MRSVKAGMCASQPNPLNIPIYGGIIEIKPQKAEVLVKLRRFSWCKEEVKKNFNF